MRGKDRVCVELEVMVFLFWCKSMITCLKYLYCKMVNEDKIPNYQCYRFVGSSSLSIQFNLRYDEETVM